jgi:hypothetical protein
MPQAGEKVVLVTGFEPDELSMQTRAVTIAIAATPAEIGRA